MEVTLQMVHIILIRKEQCFFIQLNILVFHQWQRSNFENGKTVTMSELQIGDRVQTGITIKMFSNIHNNTSLKFGSLNII